MLFEHADLDGRSYKTQADKIDALLDLPICMSPILLYHCGNRPFDSRHVTPLPAANGARRGHLAFPVVPILRSYFPANAAICEHDGIIDGKFIDQFFVVACDSLSISGF